jgi:hypothetical protein
MPMDSNANWPAIHMAVTNDFVLQIALKYCWMQWDSYWPVPMVMHHKKAQLASITVTCMQPLLQLGYPSQVSKWEFSGQLSLLSNALETSFQLVATKSSTLLLLLLLLLQFYSQVLDKPLRTTPERPSNILFNCHQVFENADHHALSS